ncbi:hypothetical protein FGO68_gene13669 [Halteria grandinella]|uniref:Uncharacterized protein n=1 Tax=Halteria grandinella TaxID=5974 RepID=A0A8J8NAG8_HALGN|nr:hypothetical protein FGO68_gene13669 [Halteria grandinella]
MGWTKISLTINITLLQRASKCGLSPWRSEIETLQLNHAPSQRTASAISPTEGREFYEPFKPEFQSGQLHSNIFFEWSLAHRWHYPGEVYPCSQGKVWHQANRRRSRVQQGV